ncbi:hypothetical protein AJ78_08525 [Emergomyces pasteurianus Ep9510]|uniref:Uncharacterized protein n=1 Tax=Emergomyces pasteurianus Ep9510 TaxID=1447872 RepID=A0A1J9PRJ0_9EURO|nr:hypothetical protein AJ78_08525 [Emergomyces pasteurianus Ep9510]
MAVSECQEELSNAIIHHQRRVEAAENLGTSGNTEYTAPFTVSEIDEYATETRIGRNGYAQIITNSIEPIVKNTISSINSASTRRNPTLRTSRNTKHTAPVQKGICAPFQRTPLGWKVDLVPPLSCPTTVYGIGASDLRDRDTD